MKAIKCVVVGDSFVDKTKLLMSYTTGKCLEDDLLMSLMSQRLRRILSTLLVFENYVVTLMIGGEPYTLAIYDTAGLEDYDRLRPLSYPQTDVFLICFSVVTPDTFDNIRERWLPEISHFCPQTPFLLVGTQVDLRDDIHTVRELAKMRQQPVTYKDGKKLAREVKAVKYLECSAVTQIGLKNVFDEAARAALEHRGTKPKKRCVLL